VNVELNVTEAVGPLMDALADARCLVTRAGETSCIVTPLDGVDDPDESLLALRFFAAAWTAKLHGVIAVVTD
jgi:hypothetical protein